jgi:hypothetical protein
LDLPVLWSSYAVGMIGMYHHSKFIGWDGFLLTLCLGWPWTVILLIHATWVVSFIAISYHTQTFLKLIHHSFTQHLHRDIIIEELCLIFLGYAH